MHGAAKIGDENIIRFIMMQCLSALARLHDLGIMHKDVKPSNILISDSFEVGLCDFGVSQVRRPSELLGKNGHTTKYAAYEYLKSIVEKTSIKFDAKYDVFSMGLVFFELIQKMKGHQVQSLIGNTELKTKEEILSEYDRKLSVKRWVCTLCSFGQEL